MNNIGTQFFVVFNKRKEQEIKYYSTYSKNKKTKNFEGDYEKTKNLKDLAILIGKAEKFICSDAAPLHVGVAMQTKTATCTFPNTF